MCSVDHLDTPSAGAAVRTPRPRWWRRLVWPTLVATIVTGVSVGVTATSTHAATAAGYQALTPARILDTRDGTGGTSSPLAGGQSLQLKVTGVGGVPADGVDAVVLNVTVTNTTAPGFLTVWPSGQPQPVASNLNWTAGTTIANLVIATVGEGGRVSISVNAGTTNVIADVAGWLPTGSGYVALTPARILDTRGGTTAPATPLTPGSPINVNVTGRHGIPSTGVRAVVLNVTVTDTTAPGFLTVWPAGQPQPVASNLNWTTGTTIPNLVIATVGTNGEISMFASGGANVIADVSGWFSDGTNYHALAPTRILDTRNGTGAPMNPVSAGQWIEVAVTGTGGVPSHGVGAVVLNVTVTRPARAGFLTIWPAGNSQPTASNLNFSTGQTIPNLVIATVGANGRVAIYVSGGAGAADIVADVTGWFPATPAPARTFTSYGFRGGYDGWVPAPSNGLGTDIFSEISLACSNVRLQPGTSWSIRTDPCTASSGTARRLFENLVTGTQEWKPVQVVALG